jgi:regulator of protease activity HflC (stomatin/prohibitin superfamily)
MPSQIYIFVAVVIFFFLASCFKVLREYERVIIFRFGRLARAVIGANGPGLIMIIPFGIDRIQKVDMRTITMDVPAQEIITKDNVPVKVNAVIYFRVMDASKAIVQVENFISATSQISQTTLRSVLGQSELDELLSQRDKINQKLQAIVDEHTEPWGIKVSVVEGKDVQIPESMQRAMAKQAEAERERRAKIVNAEGEQQAAQKLKDAADIMADNPITLQLRYLQTLVEVATEKNSTTLFPIPIDLISMFLDKKR